MLLLYPVEVAAVASVNLDEVTLVDKQRHANLNTRLQSGRLGGVGSGVALHTRLAVGNAEVGLHRHFSVEDGAIGGVGNHFYHIAFLHILNTNHEVVGDRYLLIGLLVHEDAACLVFIQILIRAMLNHHVFEFESNLEGAVKHATVGHVLQFGVHNSVAFAWFSVLEVDAHPDATVHADACTFFDVL